MAEFDRRRGWGDWECRSCAHWLNWKCGIDLGAAHEKVRVAHCLSRLPEVSAAFAAGQLSYSKVRAITRVATPETEAALVEMARQGTAAHLERIVRAYRRAQRVDELEQANRLHEDRSLRWHHDEDGSLVIRGRLTPEQGALVRRALEAAGEAVDEFSAENSSTGPNRQDQRNADALVALAQSFLAGEHTTSNGGDSHLLTVHVDAEVLAAGAEGRCELDGGPAIAEEVARRLGCDASVVAIVEAVTAIPSTWGARPAPSRRRCAAPGRWQMADGRWQMADGRRPQIGNLLSCPKSAPPKQPETSLTCSMPSNTGESSPLSGEERPWLTSSLSVWGEALK